MTVFVVQHTNWVDPKDGQLKPKFDLTDAQRFGELFSLLNASASPFHLQPVINLLHAGLQDFNHETDYVLLIGSPVLIGLAVAIAADKSDNGEVALLQWSGAKHQYVPVRAQIFGNR